MAQGLIFPQTNDPKDVNVSLIRIASMNNKDIDAMQNELKHVKSQQDNLKAIYDSQFKRWQNYRESYEAIIKMFSLANGTLDPRYVKSIVPML